MLIIGIFKSVLEHILQHMHTVEWNIYFLTKKEIFYMRIQVKFFTIDFIYSRKKNLAFIQKNNY